jgi:hypothetical protein
VSWSAVAGADYYKVKQNLNNTTWDNLYEGPALSKSLSNMAPGEYCYRVRAFNATAYSEWSVVKCTTVAAATQSEYVCEFETLYAGPRTLDSDVELLLDGRVFISHTSDNSATIFDPSNRSFNEVALPQGAGSNVAIIGDGRVLFTVDAVDPYSMLYDHAHDELTRLNSDVDCLEYYGTFDYTLYSIVTYCGNNHGYTIGDVRESWKTEYTVEIEPDTWTQYETYIIQRIEWLGDYLIDIENGLVGNSIFLLGPDFDFSIEGYDFRDSIDLPDEANNTISHDLSTIYFTGGKRRVEMSYDDTVKEAYASGDNEFKRIADMLQDRAGHAMVGLSNGNLLVLGGYEGDYYYAGETKLSDIEIYVSSKNQWFKAGSLNIAREGHKAIQLLNGEIFVYGGATDPAPGHSYVGPPEIGRCEKINNN